MCLQSKSVAKDDISAEHMIISLILHGRMIPQFDTEKDIYVMSPKVLRFALCLKALYIQRQQYQT